MAKEKISPGMQQYLDIKKDYQDAFLLFRMGDFYELFYDDAVKAAQLLELTLTSRNKNADDPIPMAGVPFHSAQQYIDTLIDLGYKVAIAEQMEDPKQATGVVKRDVVQVITPGTVIDSSKLDNGNNYLLAVDYNGAQYAVAYMDLSTGEFVSTSVEDFSTLRNEIQNLKAKELVVGYPISATEKEIFQKELNLLLSDVEETYHDDQLIHSDLPTLEKNAAEKLLYYVHETQKRDLLHLQQLRHYEIKDFLQMSYVTKSSLSLTENERTHKKHGSLLWLLDETKTAMGTRQLRQWIDKPLVSKERIIERQDIIAVFLKDFINRNELTESLKGVYDIERLATRVSFGKATPKDLLQLGQTLAHVPLIKAILEEFEDETLLPLITEIDPLPELEYLIRHAIDPDAPVTLTEGGIIKTGFDEQLDYYRQTMREGASWIAEIEEKERQASGITTLKIDYNRKDGYYFHVTNSNLHLVPEHFFRKATLKNSERFGTAELAKKEGEILEAREESANLEYKIFMHVRGQVERYIQRLQELAKIIASIDVLQSLAVVAEQNHFVKPIFNHDNTIDIQEGRHAVVEKVLGRQEYIPNSIHMPAETSLQLITGPNMSGKSTYMRQLALTIIMAQMGSYVAADFANLPVFDAIFTRIGAGDDLISGQSTFMVEMMEANQAIRRATSRSLILFDELGRGTATYDGMALAQAIIEYIHNNIGAKTLFATHYHELTELSDTLTHLVNVHVATLEEDGEVTFLHKITDGPADKSYGIHVAKIADLPDDLLERANVILTQLENQDHHQALGETTATVSLFDPVIPEETEETIEPVEAESPQIVSEQLTLFDEGASQQDKVIEKLRQLDLMKTTPIDAITILYELQSEVLGNSNGF